MNVLEGWLSLVPPLVAITLAIVTQRVVLSLFIGVFSGALILAGGEPVTAVVGTLETFIWSSLIDEDHLRNQFSTLIHSPGIQNLLNHMKNLIALAD